MQDGKRTQASALGLLGALLLCAGDAAAAEGGLKLEPGLLSLVLLALFVPLIPVLNRLLFRPILAVLDAREERIAGTRRRAEKLAADAEEILARYERSVREVREEAELDRKQRLVAARDESASQTGRARAEAEGEIERAREEIATALTGARGSLRAEAEALAQAAAARVLGRGLS